MYRWLRRLCLVVMLPAFYACTSQSVEIEGFNSYVWQQDKWGCAQERAALLEPLMESKEKVLGLREAEVIRLLGKADEMELYTRNQKFLIYYLEPNLHCTAATELEGNARALHIRLNALGQAQEMFIRKR